jgi:hypothetical protein
MLKGTVNIPGQNPGTPTNDNAAAGDVGEYIVSTVAANTVALTTTVTANVTSISLTPGDWDISGQVNYTPAASTSITTLAQGNSVNTGALPGLDAFSQFSSDAFVPGANILALPFMPTRRSLASTTTVFLVANATFTVASLTAGGTIRARRVR